MNQTATAGATGSGWLRARNFACAASTVAAASGIYLAAPYNRRQLDYVYGTGPVTFTGAEFLIGASAAYVLILALYFLSTREPTVSKTLRAFRVIRRLLRGHERSTWLGLSREDRVSVLATLLKMFYAPLMAMALMGFCNGAILHGIAIAQSGGFDEGFRSLFDRHGFWFAMQAVLFVDVLVYTFGYLVELPRLRNQIRSVDPTLLGWGAALACYPPFNMLTGMILGSQSSDFPQFENPMAHVILNVLLLVLMGIFTSASVALGFKASNLTHRGIVSRGPYAIVRHPAYTSKNMAWWIGAIPSVSAAFSISLLAGVQAVASVIGVSMLYILRALTEEDHLRSVDGEYAAYAARVRYRFIPGVY